MRVDAASIRTGITVRGARETGADRRSERLMLGVPARFMGPRLMLGLVVFGLLALGLMMIFSASSIVAMGGEDTGYNPAYYLQRQAIFVLLGVVAIFVFAHIDYHLWSRGPLLWALWSLTVLALVLVVASSAGHDAYGASRWITIGGSTLQPSEFAKITVILMTASIATRYYDKEEIALRQFAQQMVLYVGIPMGLILFQPDKGTTMICFGTLLVMGYLAGIPGRYIFRVACVGLLAVFVLSMRDDYSRQRFFSFLNPRADQFGAGYQLMQGYYAFGSGGIFGVGIALSRQKYSYLPFAYNDFIYAIVGEELGLVGTMSVLLAFALVAWTGFQIARYAPDLSGRLIAAGCTSLLVIQFLVNAAGVLGLMPLTGKPVPFLSYGGSSVLSCMILVGMIVSVSRASHLPETEFDRRRNDVRLARGEVAEPVASLSLVGDPTPRSERRDQSVQSMPYHSPLASPSAMRRSFVVHPGGLASDLEAGRANPTSPESIRAQRQLAERVGGRMSVDSRGRRRIDLGPDPASRLRRSR